jgi:hypothetical protein
MGLIVLIVVLLVLFWGSWAGRGPYPAQYGYGFPWLGAIVVLALLLYLLGGMPLNAVCLYVALIFAILAMLEVPARINLFAAAFVFYLLSGMIGTGADWHSGSMHLFHRG